MFFLNKMNNKILLTILLGLGLILLIYGPIINSYFLGEDYAWWAYVKGKSMIEVLRYFIFPPSQSLAGFYHPLVGLSYWFNVNFSWSNPVGFHFFNLIIHGLNYLLVVGLAYFFIKRFTFSLLAGILFIFFPFHSEAVAWIDGRHDLLITLFYLLSFYLGCLSFSDGSCPALSPKQRILFWLSLFSFFLALAAKEMAITLPLAVTVVHFLRCQANTPRRWFTLAPRETVGYWVILGVYFLIHGFYSGNLNPLGAASHLGIIIPRVLIYYLLFLFVSLALFLVLRNRKGWSIVLLNLLPVLAILIGFVYLPAAFTFTQERYLYLPSAFAAIFLANLFCLFWERGKEEIRVMRGILIFVLILGSVFSARYLIKRIDDWKKASEIAEKAVNDFKVYARDIPGKSIIYFLNLPDNYHGSYIFRTHVKEAMEYGSRKKFEKIVVLPVTLGLKNSSVKIVSSNHFILESKSGYLIFSPTVSQTLLSGKKIIETEDYRLVVEGDKKLGLFLKNDYLEKVGTFFFDYDGGRLKLLGNTEVSS